MADQASETLYSAPKSMVRISSGLRSGLAPKTAKGKRAGRRRGVDEPDVFVFLAGVGEAEGGRPAGAQGEPRVGRVDQRSARRDLVVEGVGLAVVAHPEGDPHLVLGQRDLVLQVAGDLGVFDLDVVVLVRRQQLLGVVAGLDLAGLRRRPAGRGRGGCGDSGSGRRAAGCRGRTGLRTPRGSSGSEWQAAQCEP